MEARETPESGTDRSPARAAISWEGDSLEGLRSWPREIQRIFGLSLLKLQEGERPTLTVRPMKSIGQGVFELKAADEATWYRVIYLAKIENTIYVLGLFHQEKQKDREERSGSSKDAALARQAAYSGREIGCQAQRQ